jgi:sulfite exporter TauE/SafE
MIGESGPILLSALLLGFVGSGHCLGMCGGIAGALGQVTAPIARNSALLSSVLYSLGRIVSYSAFGAVAGRFGESMNSLVGWGPAIRVFAGLLIVAFGLHTAGWGMGLDRIERAGLAVWRRLSPLVGRVGEPDRVWKLIALGALWGWLPCGLVYSALAAATVTGGALNGAAFMLCFGIGTMPALVLATGAAGQIGAVLRRRGARQTVGALLVLFGCWTMYNALSGGHGANDHDGMEHHHEGVERPSPKGGALIQSVPSNPLCSSRSPGDRLLATREAARSALR